MRRGHPLQRRAGGRGEPFAACEVANRSIDFPAHLPRHPLPFTLLPRGQKCLSAEGDAKRRKEGRQEKQEKDGQISAWRFCAKWKGFRIHPTSLKPHMRKWRAAKTMRLA